MTSNDDMSFPFLRIATTSNSDSLGVCVKIELQNTKSPMFQLKWWGIGSAHKQEAL